MMDQQNYGASGLFGSYGGSDPSLNIPVTKGGGGSISPFLNVDPNYLNLGGPQFIVPTGQARTRGRFELAFSQIGGSVMAGAVYGALNGARVSVRENLQVESKHLAGKVKFSQALTQVTKQGATSANAVGVVVLMYNVFGFTLSKIRGEDDEMNTIGAATITGILYKSSKGIKPMAAGGAVGLAVSTLWCLYNNKDKTWDSNAL
ncbi:mitochondrial import inner membrane translocase subunit Tim23-like [Amphiura filiformis]|uniref:mitochondrial import inner membrane translocase subunit Tim23-like n=1 Tax=Amphiura filiformis TaxID=82378 RepID=UPI003B21263A